MKAVLNDWLSEYLRMTFWLGLGVVYNAEIFPLADFFLQLINKSQIVGEPTGIFSFNW
jgi:hypothetical protein